MFYNKTQSTLSRLAQYKCLTGNSKMSKKLKFTCIWGFKMLSLQLLSKDNEEQLAFYGSKLRSGSKELLVLFSSKEKQTCKGHLHSTKSL